MPSVIVCFVANHTANDGSTYAANRSSSSATYGSTE